MPASPTPSTARPPASARRWPDQLIPGPAGARAVSGLGACPGPPHVRAPTPAPPRTRGTIQRQVGAGDVACDGLGSGPGVALERPDGGVPGPSKQHRSAGAVLGLVSEQGVPRLVEGPAVTAPCRGAGRRAARSRRPARGSAPAWCPPGPSAAPIRRWGRRPASRLQPTRPALSAARTGAVRGWPGRARRTRGRTRARARWPRYRGGDQEQRLAQAPDRGTEPAEPGQPGPRPSDTLVVWWRNVAGPPAKEWT
jgi:hypothetical protein